MGHVPVPASSSSRGVALATTGLLALALAGAPALAPPAAVAATTASTAASAGEAAVGTIRGLRAAVQRSNERDGTQRIRLTRDIDFSTKGRTTGGAGRGDLDVTDDLVVDGGGATIDARRVDRIFDVAAGATLVLRDLTLTGGAPAATESGGAVRVAGTLRATDVTMTRNRVRGELASGGAVFNDGGTVVLVGSRLARNSAPRAGGGVEALEGRTVVRRSALVANTTGDGPGNGGGLHLTGPGAVVVKGSRIVGNTASAEGGGLWNSVDGTMRVRGSVVTGNRAAGAEADQGGGGLYNDGGRLVVVGSTVEDNRATGELGSGGGILNVLGELAVGDTVVEGNRAKRAGGGIETSAGRVRLTDVDLVGNTTGAAPGNGGGLHVTGDSRVTYVGGRTLRNRAAAQGGGLWNSETGRLVVRDVTIKKNRAPEKPNTYNDGGTFTVDGDAVPSSGEEDGGGLPFPLPLPF
jgi:hypothetical protein